MNSIIRTLLRPLVAAPFMVTTLLICMTGVTGAGPIVHPGDTLSINVLNYSALIDDAQGSSGGTSSLRALNATESVVVAADGSISIPVVGTVRVSGKGTSQIAAAIEGGLSQYVRDPAVTVRLLQQGQQIFLTGATTGVLPFLPGETLATALGQLREQFEKDYQNIETVGDKNGDTFARSPLDIRRIIVERDNRATQPIDGEDLLRTGLPGPSLVPGDTLRFADKPIRVDVRGQVTAPGPIFLYSNDTLEQALLDAGGPLPSASTVDAALVREGSEVPLPLAGVTIRQNPQNGDTIIVRAAPHVTVLGQVTTPGELTLKNGSDLLIALYVAGGPTRWANVRDIEVIHNSVPRSYDLTSLQHGDLSTNVPLVDGDVVYVPEGHKIDGRLIFQSLLGGLGALGGIYDVEHL